MQKKSIQLILYRYVKKTSPPEQIPTSSNPQEINPPATNHSQDDSTARSPTPNTPPVFPTNSADNNTLVVASLNIQGQTGLDVCKQKQIEVFIKEPGVDILHLQEIEVHDSTFESCHFVTSTFEILQNNSPTNKYGTDSLVKKRLNH